VPPDVGVKNDFTAQEQGSRSKQDDDQGFCPGEARGRAVLPGDFLPDLRELCFGADRYCPLILILTSTVKRAENPSVWLTATISNPLE